MNLATFFADPLTIILCGVLIVVLGIMRFKLHPFLALLLGAFIVALLTPTTSVEAFALHRGLSPDTATKLANQHIGERIASEFGKTVGSIGLLIALASIIGRCMLDTGSAEKIVRSLLKITGVKRTPIAFFGSSFFLGIPVFFDTIFYLMLPIAKAMASRTGKNYALFIMAITGGAAMSHSLIPPTPGPLFLVSEMNIPIAMMMVGGSIVGLFTITAGYFYAIWADRRWPVPLRDSADTPLEKLQALASSDESRLPGLLPSLLPILLPVIFISSAAILESYPPNSTTTLTHIILFLGEKNVAIASGAIAALLLLVLRSKRIPDSSKENLEAIQSALSSAGMIILITAAGGAFGGTLQQSGISQRISILTEGYRMALIPMAFFITAIVRTAQGSATVAMITAAGILAGLAKADLPYHPLYLALAIACGSKVVPWMNDSGFWIVCKMGNFTERETLRTFSPILTIMGFTGLIVTFIGAILFPLI